MGVSIGTELHDYRGTMEKVPEEFKKIHPYSFPQFPGYENVGEVVEIGSAVKDVKVGDPVVSCGPHAEYVVVREKRPCLNTPGFQTRFRMRKLRVPS